MKAGRREWIGLAVLALPCLLVTMDLTVLFLAVPKLTADFVPSSTELLWITDVYGFLVAGSLIVMGGLGDRSGRRRVLLAGGAGFAVASLLAVAAQSPEALIAARALQGIAGAALLPSTMALVYTMFADPKQRTAALGAVMGCFALGAALGPLLGGALLELSGWRAVFLPNLPVMALLLVLGPRHVPEFRNAEAGRVDVASGVLSAGGILATVYAIKDMAVDGPAPLGAACLVAGVALLVAFVVRQRGLEHPLVDVRLFARPAFSTALAATALAMFVTYGTFFFASQYLQLVAGLSPLESGLWGLPPVVAMLVASGGVIPRLTSTVRPAFLVAGGMVIAAVGLALLAQLDASATPATLVAVLTVLVIGLAPATAIGVNLILGAAPTEQAGAVSGLGQAGNELGGALGIALLGSIGTAVYRDEIADTIGAGVPPDAADAARDTLGGAVGFAGELPADVVDAAATAFASGLNVAAAIAAVLMLATAAATAIVLRGFPAVAGEPEAAPGASPLPEPA
jgi:DHA2 family multidrug resistance protein-like MFS transporter